MTQETGKTIDDYRQECRRAREFYTQHDFHADNALSEVSAIVRRSLAEMGTTELFDESDIAIQREVLRGLRHYRRTGVSEWIFPHAGLHKDGGPEARAAIGTLAAAGRIPQSMTRIAEPPPKFMGLELIRGIEPLQARRACGDALLDIELVALEQEVPNPTAYPQRWTMKLLINEHERVEKDAGCHARILVRSCVATFAMHRNVQVYFWPRFSFGFVERMRVIQEPRPRGKTALLIKLDLHGKGRLRCGDMELLGLEEISCEIS